MLVLGEADARVLQTWGVVVSLMVMVMLLVVLVVVGAVASGGHTAAAAVGAAGRRMLQRELTFSETVYHFGDRMLAAYRCTVETDKRILCTKRIYAHNPVMLEQVMN